MIKFLFNNNNNEPFSLSKLEDERFRDFYSVSSSQAVEDAIYIVKNHFGATVVNSIMDDFQKGFLLEAMVNFAESVDLSKIDIPMTQTMYQEVINLFGSSLVDLISSTSHSYSIQGFQLVAS